MGKTHRAIVSRAATFVVNPHRTRVAGATKLIVNLERECLSVYEAVGYTVYLAGLTRSSFTLPRDCLVHRIGRESDLCRPVNATIIQCPSTKPVHDTG